MIVDVEHHLEPKESWLKCGGKPGQTVILKAPDGTILRPLDDASWDIEIHLKAMDKAGIDMTVLSSPSVLPLEEVKFFNDHFAKLSKQYPKRLAAFACTAPFGGKPAFEELDRSIKELGSKGVIISAVNEGNPLDSRNLWPFYEKMSELDVPIFIHPSIKPPGFDALNAPYDLYRSIGREFDLALATLRLCVGGVLEEFPDLKFIVAHFGGGYSSIKERMDRYLKVMGETFWYKKPLISEPYYENYQKYFDKLYFNMAGREIGVQTITCALTNISPKRLLFGTDYPPNFMNNADGMRSYVDAIKKLDLDKEAIDAMLGGNAAKLFHLS